MSQRAASIETILAEAVDILGDQERRLFVERACGADAALRGQVERLVACHFQADRFLESPASPLPETIHAESEANVLGTWIGPYKLREVIGEGGHGNGVCGRTGTADSAPGGAKDHQSRDG